MWSPDIYLVMYLDKYVAPEPVVSRLVRTQLLAYSQSDDILATMYRISRGEEGVENRYARLISYSGIILTEPDSPLGDDDHNQTLLYALFELRLGQQYKTYALSCYTEIHAVRETFQAFFVRYQRSMSPGLDLNRLWWDGIRPNQTGHQRWLSKELKEAEFFLSLLREWLEDSERLQAWLDEFERATYTVNNPESDDRVFAESHAIEISTFAKVRYFGIAQTWFNI